MCEKHSIFAVRAVEQSNRSQSLVRVSTPQRGKPLFSVFRSHTCRPEADCYRSRKQKRIFQHFGRLFFPGTIKNIPAVSMSYWSIFERNLVGLADFAGSNSNGWPTGPVSTFDRNSVNCTRSPVSYNSPSFDFLSETGPVGHPLKFEPAKSANPTRFLSKLDHYLIVGAGGVF